MARSRGSPHGATPACLNMPGAFSRGCILVAELREASALFTHLHSEVFDLPDYRWGQMKFETRHPPHFPLSIPVQGYRMVFYRWDAGFRLAECSSKAKFLEICFFGR